MPDGWNEFFAGLDEVNRDQVLTELLFGMTPTWCMWARDCGPMCEVTVVPIAEAWATVKGGQIVMRAA